MWHGLTTSNIHIDQVLAPVASQMDRCWWYLGGTGMRLPWIRQPRTLTPPRPDPTKLGRREKRKLKRMPVERPDYDPVDWQRYLDESRAAATEYEKWLEVGTGGCRVGKPGFFKRYAAGMDHDWKAYFASDASEMPLSSMDEGARRFDRVWFHEPPDDLPKDVCVIVRDIDAAYLDLFFRDEWMFTTVWGYLDAKGMNPSPYNRLEFPERGR